MILLPSYLFLVAVRLVHYNNHFFPNVWTRVLIAIDYKTTVWAHEIRSNMCKTLSKKKKVGLLKKREESASDQTPRWWWCTRTDLLRFFLINAFINPRATRIEKMHRKRRRTRPENSHHPFSPRYKISLVLLYLVLLLLLLLRRRSRRRRRRIQRRERYLCPSRCDLETCDFLRARP